MRIHVLSDLHIDSEPYAPERVQADVVVLAGDVWEPSEGNPGRGANWAAEAFRPTPVILVPGNHEYYGGKLPRTGEKIRAAAEACGVHYLDRDEMTLGGVRFLGCTLWTDLALFGDARKGALDAGDPSHGMRDYKVIRTSPTAHGGSYRKLRPTDTALLHRRDVAWLRARLAADPQAPTVVVTHHAPSIRSVAPKDLSDPASVAYASNLDELVAAPGIRAWIHGHTHWTVDYGIGAARVVSNPRPSPGFRPDFVIEV